MNPTALVFITAVTAGLAAGVLLRMIVAARRWQHRRARQLIGDASIVLPAATIDALQHKVRARSASRLAFIATAAGVLAGALAVSEDPLSVFGTTWASGALVAAILLIAALMTSVIRDARTSAALTVSSAARHAVAYNLTRVAVEHACIHHDINVDSNHWVDHVLLNVNGVFAIYVVTPKSGKKDDVSVDFTQVIKRSKQLQHRISKPLGRIIPVRSVIVTAGCQIGESSTADILIVAQNELVMIQGWRDAKAALMSEDVNAIDRHLLADTGPGARSLASILDNAVLEPAL